MTSSLPTGLRERKKAKTRAAIRAHAMRLFDEQGYAATTVDQIAEAADVSQSTFFRYFPTKEDVVLADDYDPPMVAALRAQPADVHPIEAIRRSIREIYDQLTPDEWEQERRRQRLIRSVPELQARNTQQYTQIIGLLGAAVAERAGLPPDDFSARVLAGAVIGAGLAVAPHSLLPEQGTDYFTDFERALALIEAGFPLG
ncbi:acyl-CoA-like ligand-binding transcription factor [Actinoplanes friuliensis]|jgi:AcrR family transcriptional regulator|uniref:HTH-type transcriptional regulator tcmR n=1 Tax=Actinoplanes friuliensis DSM 7358 TaxID=1246995 RepID=U5VZD8_9ACTN|nr:TetR family transcriptional regulator [Actinoplanes friuliensis]AGZ42249.1 HTH-type transcriptional regulator tcmR [Actinoplanes friuliensis DSM 7358]